MEVMRMTRIGIMFGCFIPLHIGHLKLIDMALTNNDYIIIGVCGRKNDRGKDFIPFDDRYQIVKEKYAQNDRVIVVKIDDDKLYLDGTFTYENWVRWCGELFGNANIDPLDKDCIFTWYTGEESYKEKLLMVHPNHVVVLVNRNDVPVSGTQIRNDYQNCKEYIDKDFINYLERKCYGN